MKKVILGRSGIEVTELCFGALPIGPLQKNLDVLESAEVIAYALESGINFIDTAQAYKTYPHIKLALEKTKIRPVVASKSTAATYEEMEKAIIEALDSLGIDYIDIFHIHAAKLNAEAFEIRKGALECLVDYKRKGIIKAIGVATHNVKLVEAAAMKQEIDIVFPLINKGGRGILEGSLDDMQNAITLCKQEGKGIYLMKALAGGTLISDYKSCMEFARGLDFSQSIAVGMVSKDEVLYNIKFFNDEKDLEDIKIQKDKKIIKVMQVICVSCGKCIETCHSDAINFDSTGKASIDQSKCIQCGYCTTSCPILSIRIM